MRVQIGFVNVDSKLVASQINGNYKACNEDMIKYLAKDKEYIECFKSALSTDECEINTVVEDEWDNWMTSIIKCLTGGIWLEDQIKARTLRMKINQYVIEEGVFYKRSMQHALESQISSIKGHSAGILLANDALGCKGRDTPLQEGPGNVKFVIIEINYFTKWIEAKPLAKTTEKEVKKFVWDNIVCGFGLPKIIVTDNGINLVNDPFKSRCKKLNIQKINTVVAHRHVNGLVERENRSLMEGIKTRLGRERKGWVDELLNVL
nr:hypothetical protein [Tanacetum cinerariifolium]